MTPSLPSPASLASSPTPPQAAAEPTLQRITQETGYEMRPEVRGWYFHAAGGVGSGWAEAIIAAATKESSATDGTGGSPLSMRHRARAADVGCWTWGVAWVLHGSTAGGAVCCLHEVGQGTTLRASGSEGGSVLAWALSAWRTASSL